MSEEEIIKIIKEMIQWSDHNTYKMALQGLLDLYTKEKEKNKRNKKIILNKLDKLKNGIENDFPITLGERQPLWEENKTDYVSKDKIKDTVEYIRFTVDDDNKSSEIVKEVNKYLDCFLEELLEGE